MERGARINLYQAAALGLVDHVRDDLVAAPGPDPERIATAFWAASGGRHAVVAELLLAEGANRNWAGWGDETPLDVARKAAAPDLVACLRAHGARSATELS